MKPGPIAAVLTCHNFGRWLPEALKSVEHQTRPAAEIVVVDDASTDVYTQQVLARLQREGTRVAQTGGRGVSAARNCGARLTAAEYLVWLDADDILEPDYFEAAGAALDEQPGLDFVSSAVRAFGDANYVWTPPSPTFVKALSVGGWPHASTMLRRRLWETIGGFDETLRLFELLDFWASAMERGFRGAVLDKPFLGYRVRPGSNYRRMIRPATYVSRMKDFYAKHRTAVESHGLALIEGKEGFFMSQRDYWQTLESRAASLEAELARLRLHIDEATRTLEARGLSRVDLGDLNRTRPLSRHYGKDRGKPIDRHYSENFLARHETDVRGRVLQLGVSDLHHPDTIPADSYDCVVLTDTLQHVDDIGAALAECTRVLRPGGVLLATVPCIAAGHERGRHRDFWRLTEASAQKLFAQVFPVDAFEVTAYGNVMACSAFLYGLSAEEMAPADLDHADPMFPVVIAIRAVKPAVVTRIAQPNTSHHAAILAYHRIAALTPDSHSLCTPPHEFREHMAFIRRECTPIGLDDLLQAAASGRIPERAVAVTLDDGYLDALTTASPILSDLGVPATFFVNSDRLDQEHERWWDILERIFLCERVLPPVLELTIGSERLRLSTAAPAVRADALERLNQSAWPLDASGRARLLADVLAWRGGAIAPRATHRVLTHDEVHAMAGRPGHTIGAHTVHHLALTTQSADTKRQEVFDDKAALEQLLQRPVHLFSYPYGDFDAEMISTVGEAGFRAAVTVQAGTVSAGTNRLLLPRFEITRADFGRFPLRLQEIFAERSRVSSGAR